VQLFPTELDVLTIFAPVISVLIFFFNSTRYAKKKKKRSEEAIWKKVTAILISFYDERRHTSQPPTFSFQLTNRTTRSRNLEIKVGCGMLSVDGRRLFLKEEASRRRREREKAPLLRGITIITIMIMIILGTLWRFHRVVKKNQLLFFIIFSLSGSFLLKKKNN
jgi:hypothetical protein